ncbi:uncharacterized protein LOC116338791 [Contarinia nasturtii]|uniref:uncharacterized protein LOC116338791 n=1 Tax=Contarinia nasturtii TaxID=265458 RepID=UPI0012D4A7D6|nr:uncharacterized protein LOC116338791 [Contarinia nasturtii]
MKSIFAFLTLMVIIELTCGYYLPIDLNVYNEPCGCNSGAKVANPEYNDNSHLAVVQRDVKRKFVRDVEQSKESKTKLKLKSSNGYDAKQRKFPNEFKDSKNQLTSSVAPAVNTKVELANNRDDSIAFMRFHENQIPNSQALPAQPIKFGDNLRMAMNGLEKTGSKIIETYNSIKDLANRKAF